MLTALLFDQDGVIVDTERDGHRVAFNDTFAELGLSVQWDVDTYHDLLAVGGGKERMRHYLHTMGFGRPVSSEEEDELIKRLHQRKTERFVELIEGGTLPLRPGVHRLMREAMDRGVEVCICTTSNEQAAKAIIRTHLYDVRISLLLAGDVVKRKKPDPAIYLLALERTGFSPADCLVIEDSRIGVEAARAAHLTSLVTVNQYTAGEDLSAAAAVVSTLGDPAGERCCLVRGPAGFASEGFITVDDCAALLAHRGLR